MSCSMQNNLFLTIEFDDFWYAMDCYATVIPHNTVRKFYDSCENENSVEKHSDNLARQVFLIKITLNVNKASINRRSFGASIPGWHF
jgi:hypothetical protein